jgi:hypothetical protein
MLTFTVKNGEDLDELSKDILKHLRTLLSRARLERTGKRGKHTELSKSVGMIYSLEVKIGRNSGLWHPHIHAVLLVDKDDPIFGLSAEELKAGYYYAHPENLPEGSLNREWWELTGATNLDYRPLRVDDDHSLAESLMEVFKYALKFSGMPEDKKLHAFATLKGKRLVATVGALRGIQLPDAEADDLEPELEDLPYIDYVYKWLDKSKGYSVHSYQRIKDEKPVIVGQKPLKYCTLHESEVSA